MIIFFEKKACYGSSNDILKNGHSFLKEYLNLKIAQIIV